MVEHRPAHSSDQAGAGQRAGSMRGPQRNHGVGSSPTANDADGRESARESAASESGGGEKPAQIGASTAESAPTRPRVGRAVALDFIKREIGEGRGFPTAAALARHCGWQRESSGLDCLHRLEADGHLRQAGRETTGSRRIVWELTATGAAPSQKRCEGCWERKPREAFWPSRHSADGLTRVCKSCIAHRSEHGRHEREARAAAS